jgi:SAM-dependent methyltransferase
VANLVRSLAQRVLPRSARRQIARYTRWPPVGLLRWGSLRRLKPISRDWGYSRGLPIDRYYIQRFLSTHSMDVRGHVLEIKDNEYTLEYGGERVVRSDVLHKVEGNPMATIVADLTCADEIPSDIFDCIICTQTLQFIYNVKAAIVTLYRILKPGGVLLVTIPGIAQISRYDMDHWGDYWRFTTLSTRLLFEEVFPEPNLIIKAYGNVLAATAFLQGLATEELNEAELDHTDLDYELLITIRARKPEIAV